MEKFRCNVIAISLVFICGIACCSSKECPQDPDILQKIASHDGRCCVVMTCSPGNEPVMCNEDDKKTTSCTACGKDEFMAGSFESNLMKKCSRHDVCTPPEKKELRIGNETHDTLCACNNEKGYFDNPNNPGKCIQDHCPPGEEMDSKAVCNPCSDGYFKPEGVGLRCIPCCGNASLNVTTICNKTHIQNVTCGTAKISNVGSGTAETSNDTYSPDSSLLGLLALILIIPIVGVVVIIYKKRNFFYRQCSTGVQAPVDPDGETLRVNSLPTVNEEQSVDLQNTTIDIPQQTDEDVTERTTLCEASSIDGRNRGAHHLPQEDTDTPEIPLDVDNGPEQVVESIDTHKRFSIGEKELDSMSAEYGGRTDKKRKSEKTVKIQIETEQDCNTGKVQPAVEETRPSRNPAENINEKSEVEQQNKCIRNKVKHCYADVARSVEPKEIIDELYQNDVISNNEHSEIFALLDPKSRFRKMYSIVEASSHPKSFIIFREVLKEVYPYLVEKIDTTSSSVLG